MNLVGTEPTGLLRPNHNIKIASRVGIEPTGLLCPKTQLKQHERIVQGEKSGQLTPQEARKLKIEQRKIQEEKRVAKADGKITPRERRIIKANQRKASRDIYVEKHDVEHK